MQISRLFEIVYVLLSQKVVTAKELAARFGVSPRTIYRDIDTLSLSGIPVYTEKGRGGGIGLLPGFVLSKSMLNEQEQDEILNALQGLSYVVSPETTGQVLNKLSAVFNRTVSDWLEVDFSEWSGINGNYFNELKTAILERRLIKFDYFGATGKKTYRSAEPTQLWFKSRAWYLKAYCLVRQDFRIFKLSRIKNLYVTDETFFVREPRETMTGTEIPDSATKYVNIVMRIGSEMAYRVYDEHGEDSIALQPDGGFIVSETWPEDEWLFRMILSYGEYMEVLEPEHIRETVKARILKTASRYT
ncbi:MAG: YafY family transcriptional regulator [Oscillospiraceae bacterium]|nr:YafY family transcriptional regulator [Oscillospiraceae bacterium]